MKIYLYAEHCLMAGRRVSESDLETHSDNPDECADFIAYEGTAEELREWADVIEKNAGTGGHGSYERRCAASIREAI